MFCRNVFIRGLIHMLSHIKLSNRSRCFGGKVFAKLFSTASKKKISLESQRRSIHLKMEGDSHSLCREKKKKWWWSESFPSLFLHHSREIEMWINEKKFTERKLCMTWEASDGRKKKCCSSERSERRETEAMEGRKENGKIV